MNVRYAHRTEGHVPTLPQSYFRDIRDSEREYTFWLKKSCQQNRFGDISFYNLAESKVVLEEVISELRERKLGWS